MRPFCRFGSALTVLATVVALSGGLLALYWWLEDVFLGPPVEFLRAELIGTAYPGSHMMVMREYTAPYRSQCTAARWINGEALVALQPQIEVFEKSKTPSRIFFQIHIPELVDPGEHEYLAAFACVLNPLNTVVIHPPPVPILVSEKPRQRSSLMPQGRAPR